MANGALASALKGFPLFFIFARDGMLHALLTS